MKMADLFNEDNRYKTAMAISGIGSAMKGENTGPSLQNMLMMDMMSDKRDKEHEERARTGSLISGLFGGNGNPAGSARAAPVRMPSEPEKVASEAMAALGTEQFKHGDRESFVKAMWPHAQRVSQQTGLDPRLVIAQAAQETGWGRSAPNNNFFGIKSHGQEGGARLSTQEHMGGQNVTTQDSFRQYGGIGQSADDYARFLQENPRYQEMLSAQGLDGQLAALGRSGYATDPNYAQSVGSIARSIGAPPQAPQEGQGVRTAQAGQIDPQRAMQILQSPYVDDSVKSLVAARLKAQMEGPKDDRTSLRQNVEWIMSQNPGMGFDEALGMARSGTNVTVNNAPQPGLGGQYSQPVTPGQEKVDEQFAQSYLEWSQGGGADSHSQIAKIDEVAGLLESGDANLTGPVVGSLPDWMGAVVSPGAVQAREQVEEVVQRNLRVVLGAQFTEKEGERLISRAYNPRLSEEQNASRLRRLSSAMAAAADAKNAQMNYFQKNGTLTGWGGRTWSVDDFIVAMDGDTPPAAEGGDGQHATFEQFSADPSAQDAAKRYGVTLDEMWEIKQGMR